MSLGPRLEASEVRAALGIEASFLGSGTFGDTWRRSDQAIKILCGAPQEPGRVQREIEALRRVRNPHVVRMLGSRNLSVGGNEYLGLTFEYVSGGDVQERIDQSNWPSESEVISFAVGMVNGLQALHESGTLHRDLKPANIALRDGKWEDPVILDLGLAKPIDATTLTVYPGLLGTPLYMAPEQLRGERAVKASDLFAIGVVLYFLIAHRHPYFDGKSNLDVPSLVALQRAPVNPLPAGTDERLLSVVDRLLSYPIHRRGSAQSNLRRLSRL